MNIEYKLIFFLNIIYTNISLIQLNIFIQLNYKRNIHIQMYKQEIK